MIAELRQFLLRLAPMASRRQRVRPERRVRLGFYGYRYRRSRAQVAVARAVLAALVVTTLAAAATAFMA